ncbi:hypothetical protein HID58_069837 [Brassica napus]|uniref:Secreted protein n=1 Tax=Brassica napus TaxID=3708 RepID=A0ABQ7YX49_BRANA|nr:hypothetical protein HID58_069837 [Brassica napus]
MFSVRLRLTMPVNWVSSITALQSLTGPACCLHGSYCEEQNQQPPRSKSLSGLNYVSVLGRVYNLIVATVLLDPPAPNAPIFV